MNKEKSIFGRIISLFSKLILAIGVVLAFYKVPRIIAEKISYRELKRKPITQDSTEDLTEEE